MIFIILIVSFFLDGLLSNLLRFSNYFYPLCFLLSLVIICPCFKKGNIKNYYFISLIMGLLYDIVYTNTLFLNFILFFWLAILIKLIYNLVPNNYLSLLFISFLIIVLYRLVVYLIMFIISYKVLSINILFDSILSSMLINFIYVSSLYVLLKKKLI